ncbi:zinc finger protein 25-like isoform X2 [Pleurodeles waltl]|uniref:zinc finger protein 25-like isoform X2 n=1 Tax=Pleurodeles waltl TaxID=8319 RepID=UPI003709B785
MYQPAPEKVPITMLDVSSYFSGEEWKLLHDWQKDLYKNVMNEIHQALVSLGPLIAGTLFSLRAHEKEGLCPVDHPDGARTPVDDHSLGGMTDNSALSVELKGEETHHPQDRTSIRRKSKESLSTAGFPLLSDEVHYRKKDESETLSMHYPCEEEYSPNPGTVEQNVISIIIKEEEDEACSLDHQDVRNRGSSFRSTGDRSLNRKRKIGESIRWTKRKPLCRALVRKTTTKVLENFHKDIHSRSQLLSGAYQEQGDDAAAQCADGSSTTQHVGAFPGAPVGELTQTYDDFEFLPSNSQFLNDLSNTQQQQTSYTYAKCGNSDSLKERFVGHKGTHSRVRPYTCTDCGKSFLHKGNLINHYRIHTGEKPYTCTFCYRSFSRKDYLNGHIRTHTGERPYKCTECEKCFTQKGELNQHRKKHV